MNAAQVLQTVLSVIPNAQREPWEPVATAACAASTPGTSQLPIPQAAGTPLALPQMIMAVFSMAAFWDWAKLILIGAFFEMCRRGSSEAWTSFVGQAWVTMDFQCDGDGSEWLMYWLSQKKVFQKARNIEVSSLYFGTKSVSMDELEESEEVRMKERVAFLPSLSQTYSLWYRGRYMTVTRSRISEGTMWRGPTDMLKIRMLTRDAGLPRQLLKEARKTYKAAKGHLIRVYVVSGIEEWTRVTAQQKRPMSSVILDPGVMELVLEDARDFLNSRKWYANRGIPFRRGYLLHGSPGSGKTSMIHSLAGELGLDIYILSLTVGSLNDNSLKALVSRLPRSCILLMEDIDAAFARGIARRDISGSEAHTGVPPVGIEGGGEGADGGGGPGGQDGAGAGGGFNGVTLSGLLNALDGIAAQEGRILFATTNDYAALDPALLRPGRLDLHVEFGLASAHQIRELFKRFYTECESSDVPAEDQDDVDVEGEEDEGEEDEGEEDEGEKDSGYASLTGSPSRESGDHLPEGVKSAYIGMTRAGHESQLSAKKAAALAERFVAAIPPHTFSMATLQGYLMAYKVRPYVAVEEAPAWVEKKTREATAQLAKRAGASSTVSIVGQAEGPSRS